jgi:D-glycero-D-manno-heptose 1,7-bisphosphate phosphatase
MSDRNEHDQAPLDDLGDCLKVSGSSNVRPVVFLDRDGTLNVEVSYIREIEQLVLLPDAAEAVRRLNQTGVATVVVTNQSGVARGYFSEVHVQSVNHRLSHLLEAQGATLDAIYYCPHHRDGVIAEYAISCSCRKPAVGLLERAFREVPGLDRKKAYMIGDQSTDIELARNAGITAVMVRTGFGAAVLAGQFQWKVEPDFVAGSVLEAVHWVLSDLRSDA